MEQADELSIIWLRQAVPVAPPEKQLLAEAAAVKKKIYFKHGVTAVLLIATLIGLNLLLQPMHFQLLSTRIGIALTNLALLVYLAASGDTIYLWMKKVKQDIPVKDCMRDMLLLKKRQHFLYGRLLGIYFVLLFTGMMCYLWEFVSKMRPVYGFIAYVLTIGWVCFAWFYIRPRTVKKYKNPVDDVIKEMERVAGQFNGNS